MIPLALEDLRLYKIRVIVVAMRCIQSLQQCLGRCIRSIAALHSVWYLRSSKKARCLKLLSTEGEGLIHKDLNLCESSMNLEVINPC
jgi:hypothetical protein